MTLRWGEGFEIFASQTAIARKYPENNLWDAGNSFGAGQLGGTELRGGVMVTTNTPTTRFRTATLPNGGAETTWICGFRFKWTETTGNLEVPLIRLFNGTTDLVRLVAFTNGAGTSFQFRMLRATSTGVTAASPAQALNTYMYVEFKITLASTAVGTADVRVNGVSIVSASSVITSNSGTTADKLQIEIARSSAGGAVMAMDDLYLCDGQGTFDNDFLAPTGTGGMHIEGRFPNAPGDVSQWTPSTGADNSAMVDETATADDDTTYNTSPSVGQKDLYNFQDLTRIDGNVRGVFVYTETRLASAGTRSYKPKYRNLADVEADGSTLAVTSTSYSNSVQVWEKNPVTAGQWSPGDFNDGQFGIESV